MPRARWLKPEFFTDKKMGEAGPTAALVYQALWIEADDNDGVAPCDPDILKGRMFTRWSAVGVPDITEALRKLFDLKRVRFLTDGEDLFAEIIHWEHQSIHKPSKFTYRAHYIKGGKELQRTVPEWCQSSAVVVGNDNSTGEVAVSASPPPRLLDSQTPRLLDSQVKTSQTEKPKTTEPTKPPSPLDTEVPSPNESTPKRRRPPKPEKPETAPAAPVLEKKVTWLTPYSDAWTERFGGDPNFGQLAKAMKPVKAELGEEESLRRWTYYLSQNEAKYANPSRFAQTVGDWVPGVEPMSEMGITDDQYFS